MKKQDKKSSKTKTVTIKEQKPRAQAKSSEKRKKTTIQTDDIKNTNPSSDIFTQNYIDTEGKKKGGWKAKYESTNKWNGIWGKTR